MGDTALTEVVHVRRGAVRVTGRLTELGADLVRGTVESLVRSGHRSVLVDLRDVRPTDAGLHVLRDVERSLAADGARLLVRPPTEPGAGTPVPGEHVASRPAAGTRTPSRETRHAAP